MIEIKDQPAPGESTCSARMGVDWWTTCGGSWWPWGWPSVSHVRRGGSTRRWC